VAPQDEVYDLMVRSTATPCVSNHEAALLLARSGVIA
jgi:hypothetical protein